MKSSNSRKVPKIPVAGSNASTILKFGAFAGLGLLGLANSYIHVEKGSCAILYNYILGLRDEVCQEGLNFKAPWSEPIFYDVKPRAYNGHSNFRCCDGRRADMIVTVLAHPVPEQLPTIRRHFGAANHCRSVLPSLTRNAVSAVGSRLNSGEINWKNKDLSEEIKKELAEEVAKVYIKVDDVVINRILVEPR